MASMKMSVMSEPDLGNLHRLKVFVEVAETRSFSNAANRLFLTQSGVSKQIRELEQSLGVSLFDRRRGRLGLTEAGQTLHEDAKKIISLVEQTQERMMGIGGTLG